MIWKVYYGDGSTFSGPVHLTPTRDVQVVVQSDPDHGWRATSNRDYYIWRDDHWEGVDIFGLYDYLVDPGWKRVLFGRTLLRSEYNAIWQQMMADPDMPPKTGSPKQERRP